jgi:hypothetical protein
MISGFESRRIRGFNGKGLFIGMMCKNGSVHIFFAITYLPYLHMRQNTSKYLVRFSVCLQIFNVVVPMADCQIDKFQVVMSPPKGGIFVGRNKIL